MDQFVHAEAVIAEALKTAEILAEHLEGAGIERPWVSNYVALYRQARFKPMDGRTVLGFGAPHTLVAHILRNMELPHGNIFRGACIHHIGNPNNAFLVVSGHTHCPDAA